MVPEDSQMTGDGRQSGRGTVPMISGAMPYPSSGEQILAVLVEQTEWLVHFSASDPELVSVTAFKKSDECPNAPNVHWDVEGRAIDESPDDLPPKVLAAIRQWMKQPTR